MGSERRAVATAERSRAAVEPRRVTRGMLGRLRLFEQVDIESIERLVADCPVRELVTGQVLVAAGDRTHAIYFVLAGRLRFKPTSGEDRVIEAGESFGELGLLEQKPAPGSVIADTITQVVALDEAHLWALVRTSHAFAGNVLGLVCERLRGTPLVSSKAGQPRYRKNAAIDVLTGLYNRRWLEEVLPRQVMRSSMNQKPLTILLIDVDHFQRFNEEFGYPAGDQALHAVGQTLVHNVRPTDLVARYAGQEFVVILPDADADGARIVADRIRRAQAEAVVQMADDSILPPLSVSLGIGLLRPGASAADLLMDAREALKRARGGGYNSISA